jgi:uncharacterized protein (TIGR02147 family)
MQTGLVYDFAEYRPYLLSQFPGSGERRGRRSQLARAIGCQVSFVSLVLSSKAHFTEDMAFAAANFLKLQSDELHFFLLLFHFEKAGTKDLQRHYRNEIERQLRKRNTIQSRVAVEDEIGFERQSRFYSEWVYIAIFTAVQIPGVRTVSAIAERLHVAQSEVIRASSWMVEIGILERDGEELKPKISRMHLDSESPFVDQHHRNWRNETVRSLNRRQEFDLHYSGAISLSTKDCYRIREIVMQSIGDIEKVLKPSPDEEVMGICFDLFRY